jgi:hypothetical protein
MENYNYKRVRTSCEGATVDSYGSLRSEHFYPLFITGIITDGHFIEFSVSKHRHYRVKGKHVR